VSDIKAIGITNQRETAVVWDRNTGKPLGPAIVWSDSRTAETVKQLADKSEKGIDAIKNICGLPLRTYFSGVKLRWMLDHNPHVQAAHDEGRLLFGTVDSWLIYVSG
jgi:glycerol kinase